MSNWLNAGSLQSIQAEGAKVVKGGIAVFYHEDDVYAIDNRCPHMGFPLHMGSLCDGILTCHWHHARFDICSGGTLDPFADDVPTYEVKVEDGDVWVDMRPKHRQDKHSHKKRLQEGMEQNIGLVIGKAVVGLVEAGVPDAEIAEIGVEFGTTHRSGGWNQGLQILAAMVNVLPKLDKYGRILALYQGLVHVARNSSGAGTRFMLGALPDAEVELDKLTAWYRSCIEVRDTQGAERILLTAISKEASEEELNNMMMIAVTDHFFLDGGHTLDFHNKAFEIVKHIGGQHRERVLSSLIPLLGNASRSEESNSWQTPINLVTPLREAFKQLDQEADTERQASAEINEEALLAQLLSDQPLETIRVMTDALSNGMTPPHLAQIVALAAAERIVKFHTQNDFGDWVTVLHTFTYAHAVHESLLRSSDPLLIRAIFHGAMSVYLNRFLNVPAAPRPKLADVAADSVAADPKELLDLLDQQQQVSAAAKWVAAYLQADGDRAALFNTLGHALLREDAEFHSYQMYEAAMAEYDRWAGVDHPLGEQAKETLIMATTRFLAAKAPTSRELPHTARIAWRLHRGERLFEEG